MQRLPLWGPTATPRRTGSQLRWLSPTTEHANWTKTNILQRTRHRTSDARCNNSRLLCMFLSQCVTSAISWPACNSVTPRIEYWLFFWAYLSSWISFSNLEQHPVPCIFSMGGCSYRSTLGLEKQETTTTRASSTWYMFTVTLATFTYFDWRRKVLVLSSHKPEIWPLYHKQCTTNITAFALTAQWRLSSCLS